MSDPLEPDWVNDFDDRDDEPDPDQWRDRREADLADDLYDQHKAGM